MGIAKRLLRSAAKDKAKGVKAANRPDRRNRSDQSSGVVQVSAQPVDDFHELLELGVPDVVGESNYQHALRRILKSQGQEISVALIPEPDNPYDRNAVMVQALIVSDGEVSGAVKVGYLPRSCAEDWAPLLKGESVYMDATLFGGTRDKKSIGVFINDDAFDDVIDN